MKIPPFLQERHDRNIGELKAEIQNYFNAGKDKTLPPLSLNYGDRKSFTVRSKSYKNNTRSISCDSLNKILDVNISKQTVKVEPRATMEMVLKATLPYGLSLPVIPEVKSMTVGGALMGIGVESSSHRWGCFHEICTGIEIILGNGELLYTSPNINSEIFYGLAGSYGSLGAIVSIELNLIPVKQFVHLSYYVFANVDLAFEALQKFYHSKNAPEFLEGFIFAKNHTVIAVGNGCMAEQISIATPLLSLNHFYSKWYYQHVYDKSKIVSTFEEVMSYSEYIFRHDQGAFWIGAYCLNPVLLSNIITQGILHLHSSPLDYFNDQQIQRYHNVLHPSSFCRTLMSPWMSCQKLQALMHRAEKWVQNRFVIQDFFLPENNAKKFLQTAMDDIGLFPIWLCPIKSTTTPQIFAPHQVNDESTTPFFIDIGLYGLPGYSMPINHTTKKLENLTKELCGKKMLYSSSYYTPKEFWEVYPKQEYERLRKITYANEIWHSITDKVLSI